ncbi:S4 domain-containing protein YaaA [Marinicrinis lubricantis]|uniref:S4 domain-containing protein YaaA n=1 Tax=Marinicrinis lubricantis TaxID=2086470 RepID=A0ABW1IJ43_9BACL
MKNVTIKDEYITLGQLAKKLDLVSTGGQVKFFLEETSILVNKSPENRRGKKLFPGDEIEIEGYETIKIEK